MRKLREVLRLRYELKLGYQVGRSCAIEASTVHKYLKRAEAAGLRWPLPDGWYEARVEESALFPRPVVPAPEQAPARTRPDFAARVNIDYHVAFDANFYSVPYNLVQELVEIRSTPTTVEILHKGTRVASHLRSRERKKALTQDQHRPKSHREHLEWTPSRMVHWAGTIGPHAARLFERIMADKPHPEMGYRGCLGIIRLARRGIRLSAWRRPANGHC